MNSVLIIEDNIEQLAVIERALRSITLLTEYARSAEEGLEKLKQGRYGLLLVDINLPQMDGFELCRLIRKSDEHVPLMFLTARADEEDKLSGFAAGADDYLVKPFGERELAARASALLRRSELLRSLREKRSHMNFGELSIDLSGRVVRVADKVIDLTALEFDLLVHLAQDAGKVFSRDELTESLWGYQCSNFGPSITSYFSRLRAKLEIDPKNPRYVQTVRGVGYRFHFQEKSL